MVAHPTPYLRRTIVVPSPYQGRFMFGFRLKAKSEHEATQVFGWYGVGAAQVARKPAVMGFLKMDVPPSHKAPG